MSDPLVRMPDVDGEPFHHPRPLRAGDRQTKEIRMAAGQKKNESAVKKQVHLGQADLPCRSLADAMRVPKALMDAFAGAPTPPHQVALAVKLSPTSSTWRDLLAASAGYGLTKGTKNAVRIELTDLGKKLVAPKSDGDDAIAIGEAVVQPTIMGGFLRKYDKAKFPPDVIAQNVLTQDFGVPKDRLETTLQHIKENAQLAGFLKETPGRGMFVAIDTPEPSATALAS